MKTDHRGYGCGQQSILFKGTRLRKSPAYQATVLLRYAAVVEPQEMESKRIVKSRTGAVKTSLQDHVTLCGIGFDVANDRGGRTLELAYTPDHCAELLATVGKSTADLNSSSDVCTLFQRTSSFLVSIGADKSE